MEQEPKMMAKSKPLFVFGTRHGTIFNITPSHLPPLSGLQLSVGDFFENKDTIKELPEGMSFKKFLGFDDNIATYLSPYDFYKKEGMKGCEKSTTVKIKCSKGYTDFTPEVYDEMATLLRPDYLVTLTEYPASQKGHDKQSNKSLKRAITKTTTYLQKSKMIREKNEKIKLLGAIHGGKNLSLLTRSLQQILSNQIVDGFVICDVCQNETIEQRQQIFKTIHSRIQQLQEKKDFVFGLAGLGRIEDIQHALKFGITIFEINYPFILAEDQKALIRGQNGQYLEKVPVLSQKLEPLDPKCSCYSCTRHSESYIAHLISCYELNAKILLSIHNLQMYIDFLAKL